MKHETVEEISLKEFKHEAAVQPETFASRWRHYAEARNVTLIWDFRRDVD